LDVNVADGCNHSGCDLRRYQQRAAMSCRHPNHEIVIRWAAPDKSSSQRAAERSSPDLNDAICEGIRQLRAFNVGTCAHMLAPVRIHM
jgi:hypothetical protein